MENKLRIYLCSEGHVHINLYDQEILKFLNLEIFKWFAERCLEFCTDASKAIIIPAPFLNAFLEDKETQKE
jgi:hypothetical protein